MKTFKQFISETSKSCNKTKEGTHCPVHGNKSCYLNAVKELEEGLKKLNNISYDSIDKLMRNIMKENDITAKQLHNAFVDIHHKTPDDWIKELNEETKSEAVNLAQQAAIAISMKKKGKKPKSEVKESCWSGYTQKGLKKKGKKIVPNCVPVEEEYTRIQTRGTTYTIVLNWRGKTLMKQMFFPQFRRPSKLEVTTEVRKIYPNALVLSFYPSMRDPTQPLLFSGEKL